MRAPAPEGDAAGPIRRPVALAVAVLALLALVAAQAPAAAAQGSARPRVSAVFGVDAGHRIVVSGRVTGASRGARALLEARVGRGRSRVRARARVRRGSVAVRWRFPRSAARLGVRLRVVSAGRRSRTLAVGRWRSIDVRRLPPAPPVADVSAGQVLSAPAPGQPGAVELRGAGQVRPGEVLALGVGDATPNGLLARVTEVQQAGGRTVALTEPATLPDVIPVGAIDLRLRDVPRARSAARRAQPHTVTCEGGATFEVGALASIEAGIDFQASWSFPRKITARFESAVEGRAEMSASVSGAAACALAPTPLLPTPLRLGAYPFAVLGIPIVVVPTAQFFVEARAEVEAAVSTQQVNTLRASAGVRYDGRQFSPFGGLTPSSTFDPPALTAAGSAEVAVAPTVDFLINGIGGPRVDLRAGLRLAADRTATPWWRLTAPLDLGAQLRLGILGRELRSPRLAVFRTEPVLAAAADPPPPASPAPAPTEPSTGAAGLPGERAQLRWDNASDVDLHIWDDAGGHAWFGALGGISSARLIRDVIAGFGPEHFVEDADPGRRYTYGICVFQGGNVNAVLDVVDPDGAVRRFEQYLPEAKSAVLVTTSPEGGGHVPAPGWCGPDDPGSAGAARGGGAASMPPRAAGAGRKGARVGR